MANPEEMAWNGEVVMIYRTSSPGWDSIKQCLRPNRSSNKICLSCVAMNAWFQTIGFYRLRLAKSHLKDGSSRKYMPAYGMTELLLLMLNLLTGSPVVPLVWRMRYGSCSASSKVFSYG